MRTGYNVCARDLLCWWHGQPGGGRRPLIYSDSEATSGTFPHTWRSCGCLLLRVFLGRLMEFEAGLFRPFLPWVRFR